MQNLDAHPKKSVAVLEFEATGGVVKKCAPCECQGARFDANYDLAGYFGPHAGLFGFTGLSLLKPKRGRA